MRVSVRSRRVLRPWERDQSGAMNRRVRVNREANVQPDAGPLALYQSVFPDRYVRWEPKRQLWEIRQRNQFTGFDERVELVFDELEEPEKELKEIVTQNDLEELLEREAPATYRVFKPFDYAFVRRRLRERFDYLRMGTERYNREVTKRNRMRSTMKTREIAHEMAAGIKEIRRWIPVLEEMQATGVYHPGGRTAMVPGGLTR
jgi:hypothetical protein